MRESTCPSCGHLLDAEGSFCPGCGAPSLPPTSAERAESDEARSRARLQEAVGSAYVVGALIGRGGFAEVFEAEDPRLSRRVAIKAVRPDLELSDRLLERFQREARAMAGLRHPHVMEIYTVGEVGGVGYFVMPLIEGETLAKRLERVGPLALGEVGRILAEAAGALGAAHEVGTIHRDVKPDNILLEGDPGRVLIADFGIAKAFEEEPDSFTGSGFFVGTPLYMSPEQAAGDPLDHRSDVYSLGVVAFEMITGRRPFEARSVQALVAKHLTEAAPSLRAERPECPERLAGLVARCLAKDPGDRWNTLADMVAALERLDQEGPPASAHATGAAAPSVPKGRVEPRAPSPPERFRRRSLALLGGLASVVVVDLVVGLGGVSAWLAVAGVLYLAASAGRLWTAGHAWRELLVPGAPAPADASGAADPGGGFGRFASVVRSGTADRAAIIKAFSGLPHQERDRLPRLPETVDLLVGRVKHLARRVATLEARIAATSHERYAARLQELKQARDQAAAEMRACASGLEELRDAATERLTLDPAAGMDALVGQLADLTVRVGRRAG